jgi:hypothetical protein
MSSPPTTRDPSLYVRSISAKSGSFSGSALLAYKLNWQSVMFVGYGDDRTLSDQDRLEQQDRQSRSLGCQRVRFTR